MAATVQSYGAMGTRTDGQFVLDINGCQKAQSVSYLEFTILNLSHILNDKVQLSLSSTSFVPTGNGLDEPFQTEDRVVDSYRIHIGNADDECTAKPPFAYVPHPFQEKPFQLVTAGFARRSPGFFSGVGFKRRFQDPHDSVI
jgi:hypothetical protein